MAKSPFITDHAIDRYIERVDSTLTRHESASEIRRISETAHHAVHSAQVDRHLRSPGHPLPVQR